MDWLILDLAGFLVVSADQALDTEDLWDTEGPEFVSTHIPVKHFLNQMKNSWGDIKTYVSILKIGFFLMKKPDLGFIILNLVSF